MQVMEFSSTQLTYLDALGIEVWLPRDAQALELDSASQHASLPNQQGAANVQGTANPASALAAALTKPEAAASAPPASAPAPNHEIQVPAQTAQMDVTRQPPAAQDAAAQAVPHFHLQFWCYRSGFWFVSAMHGLAPRHHKFVHNLALYLQGPSQQRAQKPKHVGIFSWPMLDSPNIDQSETVARHYLQQHLAQLHQLSPCDTLVALDDCSHWLNDFSEHTPVHLDTQLELCLNSSSEKQRIWRLLQPHRLP